MDSTDSSVAQLRDSLAWFAATAEQQIAELVQVGLSATPDEMIRVFANAVVPVTSGTQLILPLETLELLESLDDQLVRLCEEPESWTMTALLESSDWQAVRRTARRALAALSDRRPTLEQAVVVH
jgi:hypothetical protein